MKAENIRQINVINAINTSTVFKIMLLQSIGKQIAEGNEFSKFLNHIRNK